MVIAALLSFGILLVAWILAPSDAAHPRVEPTAVEPKPEAESLPLAA